MENGSVEFIEFNKRRKKKKKNPIEKELKKQLNNYRKMFSTFGVSIFTSIEEITNIEDLSDLVVGYARFSSIMQRDSFSIETLINGIRKDCIKHNLTLKMVFVDLAISAYQDTIRPGLNALRKLAKMGKIKRIYILRTDRLSRNMFKSMNLVEELNANAQLIFVEQDIDPTTPEGKFTLAMNGFLDENYSYKISKSSTAGHYQSAQLGYQNGNPPFGYVAIPEGGKGSKRKIGVVIPEYRPIIVELFLKYATSVWSLRELARWLNSLGIKNSRGGNFRKDSVRDMINNVYYKGKIKYAGKKNQQIIDGQPVIIPEIFDGKHEAIISEELWEKCQRVKAKKAIKRKTSHPTKRIYLVNGIIFCSECGLRLRAHTYKRNYRYYREVSEERGRSCKNIGLGVSASEIDSQISEFISHLSLPENWQQQIAEMLQNNPKKDLISEIERLKDKHQRLTDLYPIAPKNKVYQIKAQIMEVIEKIELLEARLEEEYQKPGQNLISIQATWGKATRGEKRNLVQSVINRVMCDVAERKILWIEPKPEYKLLFMYCWPDKVDETGKYWF
jgi:DNA invertase Pin-like site-specific DNA recombinase